MKILNFGSCNIDFVYKVDEIVKPGETVSSAGLSVCAGGKGLNQSMAIARSGAQPWHAGCIGSDGQFLRELLENAGVHTEHLKTVQERTGNAIIQVDARGENSIILYKGANHAVTREDIDCVLSSFQENDMLVLQNEVNNLDYIIDRAWEKGLVIALNPSPITADIRNLDLGKIQFLILNKIEGYALSGRSDPEEICNFFAEKYPRMNLVLTLGKAGACFSNRSRRVFCQAYSVDTVDTTGAGDTFLGYFVSVYTQTGDMEKALKAANMAAAMATTKRGAADAIPFKSEVLAALADRKESLRF